MSALAGVVSFGVALPLELVCKRMLVAQRAFGPDHEDTLFSDPVAFGRALFATLPEDRFDRQPLQSKCGRILLVADVRIDNREELLEGLGSEPASRLSDADILLRCWERWGEGALDKLVGDFAFAVWDRERRSLTLARDPLGERPLHFHRGSGFFAFASMPQGLHALPSLAKRPDCESVAAFAADLLPAESTSYFKDVRRVQTGHVTTITAQGTRSRRYWRPRRSELRLKSDNDYRDAFREQLDRATLARLRRRAGVVASHLSAGYDSGAVAATAARLLARSGEELLAFTAAPRAGFEGPVPRGRIADESEAAAHVAALHPNMNHIVLRSNGMSPFAMLDELSHLVQQPSGHLCNLVWGLRIQQEAQARGASVLLHGQAGNYTISAGGRGNLPDFLRNGHWLTWLGEARAMVSRGSIRWRGILDNSFGPWVPLPFYHVLRRVFLQSGNAPGSASLLDPGWIAHVERHAAKLVRDPRPPRDSAQLNIKLLQADDPGNFRKAALAGYGLDQRDPTADRRVIDFCLSLPVEQLLRNGEKRPLARRALSDRLPGHILDEEDRGYQSADWYEQISSVQARIFAARLQTSSLAASVVDFQRVRATIDKWPASGWEKQAVISEYRMRLLRTLSAAHFLSLADTTNGAAHCA